MEVVHTREELREALRRLDGTGDPRFLVPTMGSLHEGHLTLVDRALSETGAVAVSIFVNPLQFGPGEDLEAYPRDPERDLALLRERGAALAFLPDRDEMYPRGEPTVTVDPGPLAERLCGAFRPGHFAGVLTVVAKLFGLFRPDAAVFGRKDFQQLVLVRRMAADLDMGVRVIGAPVVREPGGLAMSSRNRYLSGDEREEAAALHGALAAAAARFSEGERDPAALVAAAREHLEPHPGLAVQYVELVDPADLETPDRAGPGDVLAAAVHCGGTRLIDNVAMGGDP